MNNRTVTTQVMQNEEQYDYTIRTMQKHNNNTQTMQKEELNENTMNNAK